ncbi:MAG: YbjN domain-containing protein [Gemmatimonadetes bacterium]|nr:YbjN domain-containing protein [Gemmatimonadota bacterium]
MLTRDDVESYLLRMGLDIEEVEEGLWVIKPGGDGTPVVAHYSPPLLLLRLKVMDLPADNGDARFGQLYRKLLELNATDMLHGSYGIEENEIVLSDALELETLDFDELRSSYESMIYAASSHLSRLIDLVSVAQEG